MPDDELDPTQEPGAPEPQPTFVTAEAFSAAQAQTNATLAALNETMGALREGLTRPVYASPAPAPAGRITRAQFMEAVQVGNEAVVEAYEQQQEADWAQRHVTPLRTTGLDAVAKLTERISTSDLKYYTRFKKDIDAFVQSMPAEARLSGDVYRFAHNAIVGQNIDVIEKEAREAAIRGAAEPDVPEVPVRGGRRGAKADAVPQPDDLADGMSRTLHGAGKDGDRMAQRMGYADWKDYMTKTKEYADA